MQLANSFPSIFVADKNASNEEEPISSPILYSGRGIVGRGELQLVDFGGWKCDQRKVR